MIHESLASPPRGRSPLGVLIDNRNGVGEGEHGNSDCFSSNKVTGEHEPSKLLSRVVRCCNNSFCDSLRMI